METGAAKDLESEILRYLKLAILELYERPVELRGPFIVDDEALAQIAEMQKTEESVQPQHVGY